MVYLWTDGKGWELFEITNAAELEKRQIFIGDGAWIGDGAKIGDGVRIGDGVKPFIIHIIGSRFKVSYWGEDRVDIGCQHRSIDEWLTDYEELANEHEFTPEQIAEYRGYVEFIAAVHARQTSVPEEEEKCQ